MRKLLVICLLATIITCSSSMTAFAVHDTTPDVIANSIPEGQYIQNNEKKLVKHNIPPVMLYVHDTTPD